MIIGFSGLIGSGKTTAAGYLTGHYDCSLHKFANPIKKFCQAIGLTYAQHSGNEREVPLDVLCGKSPRQLQQLLGTEFGRDLIGSDFWVQVWKHTLPLGNVVADDVRFPNEVEIIRKLGGVVILIERDEATRGRQTHISEAHKLPFDYRVENNGSENSLFGQIELIRLNVLAGVK